MTLDVLRRDLDRVADKKTAEDLRWYFKAEPGGYGAGDRFIGVRVPQLRKLARKYRELPTRDAWELIRSPIHEERLLALFILIDHFENGGGPARRRIFERYLRSTEYINNWDLVDASAPAIVGAYLLDKSANPLIMLARSNSLWERRIAIVATLEFIRNRHFDITLAIAEILIDDDQDLIHKATGWMLREVGLRDRAVEERFLQKHSTKMPRTMLRYALEKFTEPLRQQYLQGKVSQVPDP